MRHHQGNSFVRSLLLFKACSSHSVQDLCPAGIRPHNKKNRKLFVEIVFQLFRMTTVGKGMVCTQANVNSKRLNLSRLFCPSHQWLSSPVAPVCSVFEGWFQQIANPGHAVHGTRQHISTRGCQACPTTMSCATRWPPGSCAGLWHTPIATAAPLFARCVSHCPTILHGHV